MTTPDAGWVDSHCHLYMLEDSPSDVLDRAATVGVSWVVCPGVDLASSLTARTMAADDPARVRWTAGLHPHDASKWPEEGSRIAALAIDAAAIGECGLDFYRNLSPREEQIAAFRGQIELAVELGKPIVIHCRDAFADVYGLLAAADLGERAVLHSWTGGRRWTRRFLDLGVTFSFAGMITYPTADTIRLGVAEIPIERVLVETDSPYLTPEPYRAQPNEPVRLPLTGAVLAELWSIPIEDVATQTAQNTARVFGAPG